MIAELCSPGGTFRHHLLERHCLKPVVFEIPVLLREYEAEPGLEALLIHYVRGPDSHSRGFVRVARTDAPLCRADLFLVASLAFLGSVQSHVVWHDDMGPLIDEDIVYLKSC